MSSDGTRGISRFATEVVVAAATAALGVAVCYGSTEAGAGWTEMGPDAGYFPFYVGLLIVFGSAMNILLAVTRHRKLGEILLDARRIKSVASFLLPLLAYAAVSSFLGLYVGTALYIACAMHFQGKYKWWIALPSGLAVAAFFFVVFEMGFKVPLLKGPVEAWFGIY
ncbi:MULTISPECIES: tripartite tricarboxylate transporter TctB family protein [unclassified Mesorhizobium]|uniref:tripartite tricarboxylate transporter TctB family protein n=1 Tax=unclassified Mesorhizobium TaxID=325217 RepID=UPI001127C0E2|nr:MULTISPECIES: tripartite tricarboxylate transporter TctB family protein [unclassified Mesorhizobium]MBZ9701805.1 tripartite tricarboxylate transporter TctB family protein [Mesorhizobium sp. CO1-1-3]MBZ9949153.1 tripartite tricarboxylate transporter TctB family protein [Mesorhizobium sp. BR1-1-11]TPI99645.1 tripartite tricarboxylate transporter TctB family protein [Mesorhizobium sp. B2-8-1]